MNEAIARLEAKLRGGKLQHQRSMFTGEYQGSFIDGKPATDPATPAGREWWCEALDMFVARGEGKHAEWCAATAYSQEYSASRTEAIIAAIEAAAESEAAARTS